MGAAKYSFSMHRSCASGEKISLNQALEALSPGMRFLYGSGKKAESYVLNGCNVRIASTCVPRSRQNLREIMKRAGCAGVTIESAQNGASGRLCNFTHSG
jgi:hypothetical protein